MALSEVDLQHLRRCVQLARAALDDGAEPFGAILVGADGRTLYEDRNRVTDWDLTRHPEFAIARWAATNLPQAQRLSEWHAQIPPVAPLAITTVAPGSVVDGPAPALEDEMKSLYESTFRS